MYAMPNTANIVNFDFETLTFSFFIFGLVINSIYNILCLYYNKLLKQLEASFYKNSIYSFITEFMLH